MNIIKKHISMNYSKGVFIDPEYIVIHNTDNENRGANAQAHYNYWNTNDTANSSIHFVVDDREVIQLLELNERAWHVGDNKGHSNITNSNSIGIEICVNSDGDFNRSYENAIELVKHLIKVTGISSSKVVRHKDASGKYCPRKIMDLGLWEDFKNRIQGKSSTVGQQAKPQTPVSKTESKKTWEINIQGDLVRKLQNELNNQFGANIKVDGYAGDNTLNKLITVRRGARGNITRIIQELLIRKGYSVGSYGADGVFGQGTYNAILQLQKKSGLSADGIVGKNTWKALLKK